MDSVREAFEAFFREDDWPVEPVDERTLRTGFRGRNGQYVCIARARESARQAVFYAICPVSVPEARRAAVSEYLTRANYGMIIGNFELDLADGEVRYKTSVDAEHAELSSGLLQPLVHAAVFMLDKYLPGLMKVVFAEADPAEAIAGIEAS